MYIELQSIKYNKYQWQAPIKYILCICEVLKWLKDLIKLHETTSVACWKS